MRSFGAAHFVLVCMLAASATLYARSRQDTMPFPPLPEAISSFGAVVCDGRVYVFGGRAGRLPGNSKDGLSPHFCRLDLSLPSQGWETLAMYQPSLSPGLVAWNGNLYRVGGLSYKNSAGEPTKFHSLDTFAKYNPKTNTWTALPELPTPRSSLDAAVVDGRLYVVGGWNLQDESAADATWHDTSLVYDLKENGQWTPIAKPPFSLRALAVAGHKQKLYVLGGMKNANQTTRDVHVYNPQNDTWSAGPELPGKGVLAGFAISAYDSSDKLYFSGSEGIVYRLSDDGSAWQSVERLLFPRSFHRLVVEGSKVIAVGGVALNGGYLANLEVVDTDAQGTNKRVEWSVDFNGKVKQDQALYLSGGALYAFGGNNSTEPHDFSKEAISNKAYRFDLASRDIERLPNLPQPTQGGVAYQTGPRIDASIYLLGGLTHEGETFRSADTIFRYRLRSKAWMEEIGRLPTTRAMFDATEDQGTLWLFGGSRVETADQGLVAESWKWKPGSDEFSIAEVSIPTPRRSFGGARLGDRYYAIGGLGKSQIIEKAEVFDFKTRRWSEIASPKIARVFPSLAAVGGKLYLAGGFARVDGHFAPAKDVEVYDPATNVWHTAFENLSFMERASTLLEFQDRLLFYGIDRKQDGLAHFVLLDPQPQTADFGSSTTPSEEPSDSGELATHLMRQDQNKDGKLSVDEVSTRYRPIIKRADIDQDGFATQKEIEQALQSDHPPREGRGSRS